MTNGIDSDDTGPSPLGRRDFLTRAAATGAMVWAAPVILSRPAHALDGGGGTPNCRPTIQLECLVHDCDQGSKHFPGFNVIASDCPCAVTTQAPVTCIRITNIGGTCGADIVAYGNATNCAPLNQHNQPDVILSTGDWECFDPTNPVFFGPPRSGGGSGAIPNLANCMLTFRLGIWAGSCPDADSPDDAFICQTFDVTIVWDSANNIAMCTFLPAADMNSLCTFMPLNEPPCDPNAC